MSKNTKLVGALKTLSELLEGTANTPSSANRNLLSNSPNGSPQSSTYTPRYDDVPPMSLEETYSPSEIATLVGANSFQMNAMGLSVPCVKQPK